MADSVLHHCIQIKMADSVLHHCIQILYILIRTIFGLGSILLTTILGSDSIFLFSPNYCCWEEDGRFCVASFQILYILIRTRFDKIWPWFNFTDYPSVK